MEGLTVEGAAVERGGRSLFSGLSFKVPAGTALSVMGENGIGKSSLLRALAGFVPFAGGRMSLRLAHADDALPVAERTHYLGHPNGLKSSLTALANLRFFRSWSQGRGLGAEAALAAVGLAHCGDLPVGLLSAGQKRRIALAGLLTASRPLWLLDEPATALDPHAEDLLAGLIRTHLAGGGLVVAALHTPIAVASTTLRLGRA